MSKKIRPVAVPLVTVDPFFSIWSMADNLHDDVTRNWTEFPNPIMIGININKSFYSMGVVDVNLCQNRQKIYQKSVEVKPLTSEYVFENDYAVVKLLFTTPLLLDKLDIMARPVSYVAYEIKKKIDCEIEFIFGINARCCVRNNKQEVMFKKTDYSLCCGNTVQNPLSYSADMDVIDWGYLHLCDRDAFVTESPRGEKSDINRTYNANIEMPYMAVKKNKLSGVITIAYDEIKPIEYFNVQLDEYYTQHFKSFGDMVKASIKEYEQIKKMCDDFEAELICESSRYGDDYKNILALAYRQAIGAHKLTADENGELLFLSKECESNGCIGTLDVTYPSIPLFLKYNPELVEAMLRPIIKYAKSDGWIYDFAPHDIGQYPLANGQVYGMFNDKEKQLNCQMPIEESGNILLCLEAVERFSGNTPELFIENKELMKKWVDYLVEFGYDPGDQLCTDDFAGHLKHNCNLSLKAILGIASYGLLAKDELYIKKAREYAKEWEHDAKASHGATRLTFDNDGGWSLKYNMVWDSVFELNMFSDELKQKEISHYMSMLNRYGAPLDSRENYTKVDWLLWSACIVENDEYFKAVCESILNMINETPDRVPFTDWYYTSNAKHISFQNRTVVGGLFLKLLH